MSAYSEFDQLGQRQNVGISDDDLQRRSDHGWMLSYNQRAVCVRMLCDDLKHSDFNLSIQFVTFITRNYNAQKELGYSWPDPNMPCSLNEFYTKVSRHLGAFEKSEIESEYWNKISNYIELSNYKYKKIKDVECWTTRTNMTSREADEKLGQMSADQRTYISLFGAALKSNMKDGLAKIWIQKLIENLLSLSDGFSMVNFLCFAPTHDCSTNNLLETFCGDLESSKKACKERFLMTPSSDLSLLSLYCHTGRTQGFTRQKVVPDVCVLLPEYPGMFPLVIELTPAGQEPQGLVQNTQQMLSKLFFQNVIFGIVISPRSYQLSVIIKQNRNLHFTTTNVIRIYNLKDDDFSLDMVAMNEMCTFIFSVLKWAKQTNCMLEK